MLLPFLPLGGWIRFERRIGCCLKTLVPKRKIRVRMADEGKRCCEIGRKKRYLLVSGVSHRNWSQQEQGAAMKKLELQYLASQIIQIMHGRQAGG